MHRHLFVLSVFMIPALFAVTASSQEIPRPEHPLPQSERAEWLNLNGAWEFGETNEDETERYLGVEAYPEQIVVPFCRESPLSGIGRREFVKNVWYRRSFTVPAEWTSPRKRLHIGASDWRTRVWVNGEFVGEHVGGNVGFAFEVTKQLREGENTVVVHAYDDTASGLQALGKQSISGKSEGIFYTQTTGIWQTVWLEGVGESYIAEFRLLPDLRRKGAEVNVSVDGLTEGLTLAAVTQHEEMGEAEAKLYPTWWRDNRLLLELPGGRHWSPMDPFLYPMTLELRRGNQVVDSVKTYVGLREVRLEGAALLINGTAIFQRLVLDQGFYPDGVWTAPTDAALKGDIELSMNAGFNGARLHQKVFEPRFHYWADTLGYLCWGEFPSYGADYGNPAVNEPIVREWNEIVSRDRNHPSIIGWCPFNETPPSAASLQHTIVELTRQLDPSRPCIETSGWTHTIARPEVLDAHDYDQNPESFRKRWLSGFEWRRGVSLPARYTLNARPQIPFFISEYGGIGWSMDEEAWGYGNTPKTLEEFYARFKGLTDALLDNPGMFGLCYTQLTNVEQEQNGIYAYDRTEKFDLAPIRAALTRRAAYEKTPPVRPPVESQVAWTVLVGSMHDGSASRPWKYLEEANPADDAEWQEGHAPFGHKGGEWMDKIRTEWKSDNLSGRQTFIYDESEYEHAALVLHHDDACDIFLNGAPLWSGTGWTDRYQAYDVTDRVKALLKPGRNEIRFRVRQDRGGQYFDMALLVGDEAVATKQKEEAPPADAAPAPAPELSQEADTPDSPADAAAEAPAAE